MFGHELRSSEIHREGTEYIINVGATTLPYIDDAVSYGFFFFFNMENISYQTFGKKLGNLVHRFAKLLVYRKIS